MWTVRALLRTGTSALRRGLLLVELALFALPASALEIGWTRMTGQFPVECAPILVEHEGGSALLAVNRGGELMLWGLDGTDRGGGPDGRVATLPKGTWSSSPVEVQGNGNIRFLLCDVEGLVVGLDEKGAVRWQHQLPGKTAFAAATMVEVSERYCVGDESGQVTCLDTKGKVAWQTALPGGGVQAPLAVSKGPSGELLLLAGAATNLCCLNAEGKIVWATSLQGKINSKPTAVTVGGRMVILCAAGNGSLFAVSSAGKILWQTPLGDELGGAIALLPRPGTGPLILCKGLWGNLHAIDQNGRPVWTALFRSKSRSTPLVFEANKDGRREILVTTYHQHAYLFNDQGELVDDLKLSGCVNGSPIMINGSDAIVVTASLLAHRLRPSTPRSAYGETPTPESVVVNKRDGTEAKAVVIENPAGALLRVNVSKADSRNGTRRLGEVTARSHFELPLSWPGDALQENVNILVQGPAGETLQNVSWKIESTAGPAGKGEKISSASKGTKAGGLRAWATPPYGLCDPGRLTPLPEDGEPGGAIKADAIYVGEIDEAAFEVSSGMDSAEDVRLELCRLSTEAGQPFEGKITLYRLVTTGTVNGERVADALVALGEASLATVVPHAACKFWLSIDARKARPGSYLGKINIRGLTAKMDPVELPLQINILNLRLGQPFPLGLCTWDYIPNNWFSNRIDEVLDGMAAHGVNIFPRNACIPKATCDVTGHLTIDWAALERDLDLFRNRGRLLLQLDQPPITFAGALSEEKKREIQIAYLRQLRDRLREHGRDYGDYAFYPVDEPGLGFGNGVTTLAESARLFHAADPKFLVYTDPVPQLSKADFDQIDPGVDVWCPNMRLVTGLLTKDPRIAKIKRSGKPVWSYECVGQVRSLSPLRYNRANAWRAAYFGLQGIGFWTFSTTEVDHWYAGKGINDEYALVYPGLLPVASVRWEAVRDGLEDVAALKLLQDALEKCADSKLVNEARKELRISQTDILEMSAEAFVESRDYLRAGDRTIRHNWADTQTFIRHRKRIAELTLGLTGAK